MRYSLILFFAVLGIACQNTTNQNVVSTADSINSLQQAGDTIYRIDDFLFSGRRDAHFGFVTNGIRKGDFSQPADTLYHDSSVILLGDFNEIDHGIYRKNKAGWKFEMFPAGETWQGKLKAPDFSSDTNAAAYREKIIENCRLTGINFAGHYTAFDWGYNATDCREMAIVDRINGRIIYSAIPFDTDDGHLGIRFKTDSRLLIVNSDLFHPDYPDYYLCSDWSECIRASDGSRRFIYPCNAAKKPGYYEFTGQNFKILQ